MERRNGFTILELMIVVAILAVILSIAIPSLLGASKSAKETRAIGTLRMAYTVNQQYSVRFGSYPSTVDNLVDSGMLLHYRPVGTSGPDGYGFTFASSKYTFAMQALPDEPGVTGDRYFFIDHSGVIRFSSIGPATLASRPID
jgi:type IV pilus assembly protein PilE